MVGAHQITKPYSVSWRPTRNSCTGCSATSLHPTSTSPRLLPPPGGVRCAVLCRVAPGRHLQDSGGGEGGLIYYFRWWAGRWWVVVVLCRHTRIACSGSMTKSSGCSLPKCGESSQRNPATMPSLAVAWLRLSRVNETPLVRAPPFFFFFFFAHHGPRPSSPSHEDMKGLKKGKKMEKVLRQGLRDWILVTAREQIFSEEMFAFPPSRVFIAIYLSIDRSIYPARPHCVGGGLCSRTHSQA